MARVSVLFSLALLAGLATGAASRAAPPTDCDLLASAPYDPQRATPGVEAIRDPAAAVTACQAAAPSPRASFQLGRALAAGKHYREALAAYHQAADQGYPPAMNDIGQLSESGRGAPHDDAEAAKWYRKAADLGLAIAQSNLGGLLERGRGVPQDYTESLSWILKAADQGCASAQRRFGWAYESGHGVAVDLPLALEWYGKAAAQGDAEAQAAVARLSGHRSHAGKIAAPAAKIALAGRKARAKAKTRVAAATPPNPPPAADPPPKASAPTEEQFKQMFGESCGLAKGRYDMRAVAQPPDLSDLTVADRAEGQDGWFRAEITSRGVIDNVYVHPAAGKTVCGFRNWTLSSMTFTPVAAP
jgi:TPR repeat protein